MCRNISADYGSRLNHSAFANTHIWQDNAMRPDEDVLLDYDRTSSFVPPPTPIEMTKNRGAQANRAIISDEHFLGTAIIYIHEVRDPNILSNVNSTHSL
jgi:hypothetical protein